PQRRDLPLQSVSASAGLIATDSPQPQADVWLGLRNTKPDLSGVASKSISVPRRNSTALASTSIFTPLSSTISSKGRFSSAHSIVYSIPAQPPFFTPTRRPAKGRSDLARISRSRADAVSVSVMTLGRGRGVVVDMILFYHTL